jgi:glycosyltransferase involved in cell wall biosynthesis
VPIITTVHSDYRLDFQDSWYKNLIFTYLNKKGLQKMDFYLSVSSKLRDILAEQGFDADRIFPIYNGLPVSGEARQYNDPMESIVFGCATRLVPIKGTDVLLKACNECIHKGYNIQLKVAGTGEGTYTQELKDYIITNKLENHVELLGFVKDMDSFYKSIDVNILPSYTEGLPYSLLESGARGIATIASKAGGIVEMITDGDNGRLFKVGDHSELAKIMMDMMDNKQKLAPIGQAFRDRVELQFSDTAMAKEHVSIYKNVIKSHQS